MLIALLLLQRGAPTLASPARGGGKLEALPASGGGKSIGLALLGVLAAVPTWGAFTEGQPTAWLLLGATMIVLAMRSDSPALAAGAGMVLAVKPQYLPVYLTILFAARRWRSLGAAATGGAIVLLSPLVGGAGGLSGMVHNALSANQAVAIRLNESWIGGALAVLASPHALPHDLLILAVPAWLAIGLYRQGALPNPLPALLAIDLALLIDLRGLDIPLGPIVVTAIVAWYGWQFRQRAAQQRRPPIGRAA